MSLDYRAAQRLSSLARRREPDKIVNPKLCESSQPVNRGAAASSATKGWAANLLLNQARIKKSEDTLIILVRARITHSDMPDTIANP